MGATAVYTQEVSAPDETQLFFTDTGNAVDQAPATFGAGDLIRMVLVLVAVVIAIYLVIALLKRLSREPQHDSDTIRVLASRSVSGNKAVHVVQVGNLYYLLGSGDTDVGLIAHITDQETIDQLQLARSAASPTTRTFAERLSGLFAAPGNGESGEGVVLLQRQRERLRSFRQ